MNSQMFTPDFSHITGLLHQLNDEELTELLNSEEKLKAIVNDLKQVHDIEAEREMLIASNKSISEYNLSKKPILDQHRQQVMETQKIAVELKENFLEKKKKIEQSEKAVSKETLLALLQAATSEVEEEAEASVEFFLKSELSVEDFIGKYLELRKLAHLRRIKAEKLTNLLRGEVTQNALPFKPKRPPPVPPVARVETPPPNSTVDARNKSNTPYYGPVRTAPHPPASNLPYPTNVYYPNQVQPAQPFRYIPPAPFPGPGPYSGHGYYNPNQPQQFRPYR